MLKIYGSNTFNAAKVVMTAEETGMEYEYIELNFSKGEHKAPAHMARHPLGKVPAIEHDGRTIFESNVICRYLGEVSGSPLYPRDIGERVVVDEWIDMMGYHAGRWLSVFYFQEYIKKLFFKQDPDPAALDEARGFLDAQLPVLDQHLGRQGYFAGDKYTIADIIAFCYVQTHEKSSVTIDGYPNLDKWYAGINGRPSVAAVRKHIAT